MEGVRIQQEAIESPCSGLCLVKRETQTCIGCRRSLAEIANWKRYSAKQRAAILKKLEPVS